MAIIQDVDSDEESNNSNKSDTVTIETELEESNYEREERDFVARKEAALLEEQARQPVTKPQRVQLDQHIVNKARGRESAKEWSGNAALNDYLNGRSGIAALVDSDEASQSPLWRDALDASKLHLSADTADLIVRPGCVCTRIALIEDQYGAGH